MKNIVVFLFITSMISFQGLFASAQVNCDLGIQKSIDPSTFNGFEIQTYNNGPTAPGDIFVTTSNIMGNGYKMIIDNFGDVQYYEGSSERDFKVLDGNKTISFSSTQFLIRDSSFAIIDSFKCKNYDTDFQDIDILPNGNALLICKDVRLVDMSNYVIGGDPNASVRGNTIQEIDKVTKDILFEWSSFDHFQFTDIIKDSNLTNSYITYTHMNSIQQDTDGHIIISSRHMDEITKINRNDSSIIWRFGGDNNQFELINEVDTFGSQHDAKRVANGNLTLFDNANYKSHNPRGVEYELDEVAMTATKVWEQSNPVIDKVDAMGNLQKQDNGNYLIGWGKNGYNEPNVSEYASDGTLLFEMYLDSTLLIDSYRAYRFVWPPDNPTFLQNISTDAFLFTNYPNPFSSTTTILLNIPETGNALVKITDLTGKTLETLHNGVINSGVNPFEVDLSSYPNGIYICNVVAENYRYSKKLLKR